MSFFKDQHQSQKPRKVKQLFALHNTPNLDCARFFLLLLSVWPKIKLLYTVSLIFLLQHSMTDCQGEFLSSIQVTLILLSMVANGNWRPCHMFRRHHHLMSDSAVLCFCQFIACFLSHMPVKFAIHVNLSNSRKPTRSLKPIYQNTCSMPTSEVARGRRNVSWSVE